MSNIQPNKTDPLWFLDGHEDKEKTQNTETDNIDSKSASDEDIFDLNYFKESDAKLLEEKNKSDSNENHSIDKKESTDESAVPEKVTQDEITLKSEIENSIFDLAKIAFESGKRPEFRITISSDDDITSPGKTRVINLDRYLKVRDKDYLRQNEQSEQIDVDVNSEENDKPLKESSTDLLNNESLNDKAEEITKPKVVIVLKSNFNINNDNIANVKLDTDEEVCSEIGSSVINLNDYISPQAQPLSGSENISTSVNFSNNDDAQNRKVELVVTIKDERNKRVDESITENTYTNEINTDFPNLDSLLNDSLEESITSLSQRLQKLSSGVRSLYNEPLQTTKPSKMERRNAKDKWSTETKDSYVREDGARCYRTVTTTPQGRRVHTQCYNGDRRRTRHNYRWPLRVGSIWNELDDDIDLMFSRVNPLMFF